MSASLSSDLARLGRAVRVLRARRSYSQEDLGYRSGIHRNYVGAIERGETNPTFTLLVRLSRGLDFHLSVLMEEYERLSHEQDRSR